ncbi:MAG: synthase subunit alpha, F-type H+-transporting ATPase subunit alpha [Candidatus Parcubacteria bacterium]|jgi:F-type H+-transporting ATPase subunit alpha
MSIQTIIKEIEEHIDGTVAGMTEQSIGTVDTSSDGIVRILGLRDTASMEMLTSQTGETLLALNLEADIVGAVTIGNSRKVKEGDTVTRTGKILSISVGEELLGRVVDPLLNPLDGKGDIKGTKEYPIERIAAGVMSREPVNVPLQTGIKAIDAMIPVGRGQRELIIGDRQTGKTSIAIDTIINQKGKDIICVYVAISQKESKIAQIVEKLRVAGALEYTVIVLAGVSQGSAVSYIAPYSGTAVAEFFMDQGRDALVVYDDLSKHAVAYRELSLLLRRPPGREAYPGDVFYLHSRLLERSCRRNVENGGGSITALPIIETQAGDISAYIPTNVISITDGQIFLDSNMFNKGIRPAIDVGFSVSRVGSSAQVKSMKKVAGKLKLSLAQYRELESFAQFDSDLDPETKRTIERGKRGVELLKQIEGSPLGVSEQVITIFALGEGYADGVEIAQLSNWEKELHAYIKREESKLYADINTSWSDEIATALKKSFDVFKETKSEFYIAD